MCIAGYYPYAGGLVDPEEEGEDSDDKTKRGTLYVPHATNDIKCPRYGSVSLAYLVVILCVPTIRSYLTYCKMIMLHIIMIQNLK